MRTNTLKAAALAAMAGTMLQFGGCLNLNRLLGSILEHYVTGTVVPLLPNLAAAAAPAAGA